MEPLEIYKKNVQDGVMNPDAEQMKAVLLLQSLFESLLYSDRNETNLLVRIFKKKRDKNLPKGLYLWGGVGRGKTFLMDLFFDSLPLKRKTRLHFHRFMMAVHLALSEFQGRPNPLKLVAEKFQREATVLCFDEFYVSDIGDAMLLDGLLQEMFSMGMTFVATSNVPPHRLYENGLQRAKFLPAIALIEKHTHVHELAAGPDYRFRDLKSAGIYHYPLGDSSEGALERIFQSICNGKKLDRPQLVIEGRKIRAKKTSIDIAWFDFSELCGGPRSSSDYVKLGKMYQTIIVSNVPFLRSDKEDQARRFISLVDELYDNHVKLIISAEARVDSLYLGEILLFEFQRTVSRLTEMQSVEYLKNQHLT